MIRPYSFIVMSLLLISQTVMAACESLSFNKNDFIVCTIDKNLEHPVLVWKNNQNIPFKSVRNAAKSSDHTFSFLMNAGMYHDDLSPVGLYIENSKQLSPISTQPGPGNFHLMPNGVFHFSKLENGTFEYQIQTTEDYTDSNVNPMYATQSGPMLVINNQLHPRFIKNSDSKFIRNGVGIDRQGKPYFVITKQPINFYDFATFFRDILKTPNALYFDGKISTLYAPPLSTISTWFSVGPMVGAVKNE
ncbi:phosphodiester glycosidase family protein [Thorsellia anophelis]|uniref:Uncharacterized protein YigE, DUF2233 family n=1 Tax=Thorsellia anophelis DSM 18579 TaxID=1123402 RepID=A0A1H9ZWE4_9GAMM|nr:phosphodiester glycosidase family protein [Thorsellia anophelis]SES86060.1 Uncharacterized protein YigE, DUF2233 family [Thorsellia anophelis DSM 18579]